MSWQIIHGDCREILRTLPAESVHCCVTSPPYWGLRDYGTATWDGGDAACDHKGMPLASSSSSLAGYTSENVKIRTHTVPFKDACGKCGARRIDQQIGLEQTPDAYVAELVAVFREVRRVLRDDGVLWLNLGDSYATGAGRVGACPGGGEQGERWKRSGWETTQPNRMPIAGLKPKDLVGIPWRVAFALQADGWWLRSDCIWAKPNPMPESVTDRPTKAHEYVFLLAKGERYFFNADAVREQRADERNGASGAIRLPYSVGAGRQDTLGSNGTPGLGVSPQTTGRNIRSVWTITMQPFSEAHFAVMPPALAERCINAGTSEKGCCAQCGAPNVSVVERPTVGDGRAGRRDADAREGAGSTGKGQKWWDERVRQISEQSVRAWTRSCDCAAATVPCTVLDPFAGAGTTGLVADRLGRSFIGIELNPDYAEMARRRLRDDAPLFTTAKEVRA